MEAWDVVDALSDEPARDDTALMPEEVRQAEALARAFIQQACKEKA
jgi:hypothetical protein